MSKIAFITGVTGQTGSYLAEYLLKKGYKVFGLVRRTSSPTIFQTELIQNEVKIIEGDLLDMGSLIRALEIANPDEVYNLAGQSFVHTSWLQPHFTAQVTGLGVLNLLEAIRLTKKESQEIKFLQASSSEMYGKVFEVPQNEMTPFYPRSPYAVAKTFGHYMTINYRESYNMFCVCAIMFNHESPRRGVEFVTRKIAKAAANISLGLQKELFLGNLEAKRDWGFAGDYVEALWLMMQSKSPKDYVIATGETHSVKEFCELAFSKVGLDYRKYVKVTKEFIRPSEVDLLRGDPSNIKRDLGWKSTMSFKGLVEYMVSEELISLASENNNKKIKKKSA